MTDTSTGDTTAPATAEQPRRSGALSAMRLAQLQHERAAAGRQFFQAARDRGQGGGVAHQQVPGRLHRDDEGAARAADLRRIAGLRAAPAADRPQRRRIPS